MFDKIGGRKLIVAMIVLAAGVAIDLTTTRGLSEALMYLMLGIIGTFSVTNVASKAATRGQEASPEDAERQSNLEQYAAGLATEIDKNTLAIVESNEKIEAANKRTLAILEKLAGGQ